MQMILVVAFLLLTGCSQFDYPGGPKDIARQNQQIHERMRAFEEQRISAEKYEEKRKTERDAMGRQEGEDYQARVALAEEQRKFREEEGRKVLEAFVEKTSAERVLVEETRGATLELNQRHAKDIESHLKRKLRGKNLKVRCKFEGNGAETDEVQCAVITLKKDRPALHNLQNVAYTMAIELRGAYPLSYSIFAQTSDDTPLARFMYNYHFDVLTKLTMWH